MPGLSTNALEIYRRMNGRSATVKRELEAAARQLAPALNAEAKKVMQSEIYDVPIPLRASANRTLPAGAAVRKKTTKGKHGKWSRTGALKRAETARAQGMDVLLLNNQNYAFPRYTLGTSKGRRIVSPGVKSVQWQGEAVKRKRALILERRREAVIRGLARR